MVIKPVISFILLLLTASGFSLPSGAEDIFVSHGNTNKDSVERQILYNGRLWKNEFLSVEGHQFIMSPDFLPGVVIIDNHIFENVWLRYDIHNDELLIQRDANTVIRTNRDLINSFDIIFNDERLHFVNFDGSQPGSLKGYYHVYYNSGIKIYIRYSKEILSATITYGLPRFNQLNTVILNKNGVYSKVGNKRDLLNHLGNEEEQRMIRKFIRTNYFKITKKDPSSFRRVVEYYESIITH